jgi:hypothetical protein
MEKGMPTNGHRKARGAAVAALAVAIAALIGAPSALADDPCLPENGCVPPVVAPPVPPDQFGDPQPITIGAIRIPDVPPYVDIPMPPYTGTATGHKGCKHNHARNASATKRCKKKRR